MHEGKHLIETVRHGIDSLLGEGQEVVSTKRLTQ